jgi:hypothetical protein
MLPDARSVVCPGLVSRRRGRLPALLAAGALALSGCSSGSGAGEGGRSTARAAAGGDRANLRGVCPATVTVQSSWFPQVEHSALYQLLGRGFTVDAGRKSVTGPLVAANGVDTGVRLQVRAGGPAIGFQQVSAQMSADRSITLGMVNTDELIQQSSAHPLLGVVAPLALDPQVLVWDPAAHPGFTTISDVGQTDTTVLYYQGSPYMDYLLGAGILRPSQVDSSYNGGPDRFVAARGRIVVQGYATNEPWAWQHEVTAWGRPLRYALVNDTGYPNYANILAIRPADRGRLDACLRKLVPVVQQAQVDFLADPGPATDLIVRLVGQYKTAGFTYTRALADYAVTTMRDEGIVGNGGGPAGHTLGGFDEARIRKLLDILVPIFTGQNKPIRADAGPADLVTNDYLDPAVGLPTR